MKEEKKTSRRDFLKTAAVTGAGLGVAGSLAGQAAAQETGSSAEGEAAKPADLVPRKKLGKTGEEIPILVLGCAQRFDEKYDKILHRAFKEGVNYLDTALVYADGWSHKTIEPFIKQIGDRKKLWITSKGPSKDATVESYTADLDKCLEQMETDYLDLYFMHFIDDLKYLEPEYIKMGEKMRASGKTRYFGFSCHGGKVVELMNRAAEVGGIDAIMFRYSFARYGDLELNKAIDNCKKAGIGLIAMKTQESIPDDQADVVKFESKNFNLAQAKLKAVWADERIDSAISHMDNTTKLAENVAAAKSPVQLSMSEYQQLRQLAVATSAYSCHGCSQICESRIDGEVRVADTLRYLMYHECYGEPDRARQLYRALRAEEREIAGVDFARAEAVCPQGIRIAERMTLARRVLEGTA
jgi:predicted aldo/keto reductase-like oxidoreductase